MSEIKPGSRIGGLRIEREIGRGAFSRVWLARDVNLNRAVAVKVLERSSLDLPSPDDRARFLDEARIVAGFNHPNIAVLHHLHETAAGHFALELEYLDGGSLEDAIQRDGRLPTERVLEVAGAVAAALAEAHAARVVHGDVKPGNVMLGLDGRIKLGDFGLAKLLSKQELERSNRGAAAGTPHYMAPEVVSGEPLSPASDVWSLGVLLYRAISGEIPFARADLFSLFLAIQNVEPPPLDASVPPGIANIIDRCLAKRVADRFRDGGELLQALERRSTHGGGPPQRYAFPPTPEGHREGGPIIPVCQFVGAVVWGRRIRLDRLRPSGRRHDGRVRSQRPGSALPLYWDDEPFIVEALDGKPYQVHLGGGDVRPLSPEYAVGS